VALSCSDLGDVADSGNIGAVTIDAVIFDWGGTLTPWHTIDHVALWQAACAPHFPAAR